MRASPILPRLCLLTWLACSLTAAGAASRPIPSAQNLAAMVPTSGKLGERELTLLALSQRPQLERLRGVVKTAKAQTLAAHDLPNPELRLSYAYDNDALIRSPYTESETWSTNAQGTFDTQTNTTTLNGPLAQHEQGTVTENRTRVIERTVKPGVNQDVIEERVYETDGTRTSTNRERTKLGTTSPETEQQNDNRRLLYTNRRVINHQNPAVEDAGLAAFVRFTLPHPWERRARIQRAAAEVTLAESEYFAEEDIVVRTVRAAFQELALIEAKLTAQQRRKASVEGFRDWLEKQSSPRIGLDLAAARAKVYNTLSEIRTLESSAAAARRDLASYCGIRDAGRINAELAPRRIASPAELDVPYLTSVASLYRSDLLGTQARLAIARAQLAEAKAASIPFTTFLDLGYTHETTTHRLGDSNEFVARVGISLPIWEWVGLNKKREVPKAATLSLEQQVNMQRDIITNEIYGAVKRLSASDEQLTKTSKDIDALKADMKKSMKDTMVSSSDVNELVRAKKIEQEFEDLAQQLELSRWSALSAYNESLLGLEKALGARIERVLDRTVQTSETTATKK